MNTKLFRKSSIDRVNSPEQLNEYIRVTNPGVWLVLAAIVVLLVGVLIWSIWGAVETTVDTGLVVDGDTAVCYVSAEDAAELKAGMSVSAEDMTGSITNVIATPVQVDDSFNDYVLYLTGFAKGDFCYAAEVDISGMADGVYAAVVTVDSTHPISFVTN